MIAQLLRQRPKILIALIVVIIVAGAGSYWVLPQLEDPVLGKRVGVISTIFPGADAQNVEQLVTRAVEERLTGIADVQRLRSNSRPGISNIIIELADEISDVQPAWNRVRDAIENVEDELPASCRIPKLEIFPLKAFASIVALKSRDPQRISLSVVRRIAENLSHEIRAIKGTQTVSTFGDPGEEFLIQIDSNVLASTGLTIGSIANQIASTLSTQPAGYVRDQGTDLLLDLSPASAANVTAGTNVPAVGPTERLNQSLIRVGSRGETVRLSDIASVEKTLIEPASDLAIIDGQNAIVIGAMVDDRLGVSRWADGLETVLAKFETDYGAEIEIQRLFSQQRFIENRLRQLLQNLVTGTLLVILVVLLMMGWRSMIVVALALPLSAALVITGMRWMEIPLHQMSVTGLIVALGLLIDNAIVMVEDLRQRLEKFDVATAIKQSIVHLRMPLLGSTVTTTLAFLPIATLPGPPGEFVGTIAVSVILAIVASFFLAMTVIPAVYAVLQGVDVNAGETQADATLDSTADLTFHSSGDVDSAGSIGVRGYRSLLKLFFRFPVLAIAISVVVPAIGFYFANQLPVQFFPATDRNQIQIEIELSAASPLASTAAAVAEVGPLVNSNANVQRVHWFVGRSAPTFYYNVVPRRRGTPFYAQGIVDLAPGSDSAQAATEIEQSIAAKFHEGRVVVRQLEQGPPFDAPIEVQIQGPDLDTLKRLGDQIRLILSQCPHVTQTRSDLGETVPKLVLDIDAAAASQSGVDRAAIATQLYSRLEGLSAGTWYEGGQAIPVRVVANPDDSSVTQLASMNVSAQSPAPPQKTPLASIANWTLGSDVGAIVRIDGKRTNEVMAYLAAGVLPDQVLSDFKRRLADSDFTLPPGYELSLGGESRQRSEAVDRLVANSVLLFALMVLTLVVSFGSLRHAMIVMVVGGLSIGLGPLALWVAGFPFGFMAIVGTMGLVGVAINDSIVVLAAIAEDPVAATGDVDATCDVVIRCTRHILATTLTTVAGFTPLILAGGKFWPPLAVTIAGGVGGATLMALLLAPALHLVSRIGVGRR